jgi:hypothetical protein
MIIHFDFNRNILTKNEPFYPEGHKRLFYTEQDNGDFVAVFFGEPHVIDLNIKEEYK